MQQKQRVKDLAQEGKVLFANPDGTEEVITFQEAGRPRAGTEARHQEKVAMKERVVSLAQERKGHQCPGSRRTVDGAAKVGGTRRSRQH